METGNADVGWVNADTLVAGDDHCNVTLWQLGASESGASVLQRVLTLCEHSQPVTAVAPSPMPTRLASTSLDGSARVWAAVQAGGATHTLEHLPASSWVDVHVHGCAWLGESGLDFHPAGLGR